MLESLVLVLKHNQLVCLVGALQDISISQRFLQTTVWMPRCFLQRIIRPCGSMVVLPIFLLWVKWQFTQNFPLLPIQPRHIQFIYFISYVTTI
jgi:hypothetical protein